MGDAIPVGANLFANGVPDKNSNQKKAASPEGEAALSETSEA